MDENNIERDPKINLNRDSSSDSNGETGILPAEEANKTSNSPSSMPLKPDATTASELATQVPAEAPSTVLAAPSRLGRKKNWKSVNTHLDSALNKWNEISEKTQGEVSPDRKQLQEVKDLLQHLKTKLDQF